MALSCNIDLTFFCREVFSISISENFKPGAGIFDIIWETPNVFLTCGYDTYVRLWDLR